MHIKILGYHIFQKGGTSRSNLNMMRALIEAGHEVTYINYVGFRQSHLNKFVSESGAFLKKVNMITFKGLKSIVDADMLILTREDFFHLSREVKYYQNHITILGEIHGPLNMIAESEDLALETIDAVRVSTPEIAEAFKARFEYPFVFPMYVNTNHIELNPFPVERTQNLMIKARFEDQVKDISYALRLMRYIVHIKGEHQVHLYLQGYGPSLELYETLIQYYQLETNVHINTPIPKDYIYISTSFYETLGYSILEAIGSGNRACIYPGDDGVLASIYKSFYAVSFMNKNLDDDYHILKEMFEKTYSQSERTADVEQFKRQFSKDNSVENLIQRTMSLAEEHHQDAITKPQKSANRYYYLGVIGRTIKRMKRLTPHIPKPQNNLLFKGYQKGRSVLFKVESNIKTYRNRKRQVSAKHVFIESFHGKNFSGDPKYIALAVQRLYPDTHIYVSSVNALVDMEIRSYQMTPVRFGSKAYVKAFEQCRYIVINGNLWDRLTKHPDQKVIQTWHGFPMKRMVNDLNDSTERMNQSKMFQPRMLKWDVVLSSSQYYESLITSAFNLKQHPQLVIWNDGAPRNSVLLQNDEEKRSNIQEKYLLTKDTSKRYILFCPTWRKGERHTVSELDLKALVGLLPENYDILVKLHPNEGHMQKVYQNMHPRIHCFDNSLVDIQELYIISDALITDYSSAIFDYAHLNRPIIVLTEDVDDYKQEVGFYFDIESLSNIDRVASNAETVSDVILNKKHVNHQSMTQQLMGYDQPQTDEQVAKRMMTL